MIGPNQNASEAIAARPAPETGTAEPLPLNFLRAGDRGIIVSLLAPGDAAHRLQEIGLCKGREIRVFRPGNPCIVHVGGSKLCLRSDDVQILVEPLRSTGEIPCRHRHRGAQGGQHRHRGCG